MWSLEKIENKIGSWFNSAPHLPESLRKWIGRNIWWLAIIRIIGLGTAIYQSISTLIWMQSVYYQRYSMTTRNAMQTTSDVFSLIFSIVIAILLIRAIVALKAQRKDGWAFLFIIFIITSLQSLIFPLLNNDAIDCVISLALTAVWIAISAYFLFEIRSQFNVIKATKIEKK